VILIENEGALFRGPAVMWPQEIWNMQTKNWEPYTGAIPKRMGWGSEITEAEFEEFKAEDAANRAKHPA
jgi:hypothetical protein